MESQGTRLIAGPARKRNCKLKINVINTPEQILKNVLIMFSLLYIITLYNVCAVLWGVCSTLGVFSTVGDIMINVGDILSTVGISGVPWGLS